MRRSLVVSGALFVATALAFAACGTSESGPGGGSGSGSGSGSASGSGSGSASGSGSGSASGSGSGSGSSSGALPPPQGDVPDGGGCGATGEGVPLHVAADLDLCMPPVVCTSETCPPALGDCVNGRCVFKPGYQGVSTLPEAWVTYYCQLSTQGCHGVTQIDYPEVTAQKIATATGMPLCDQATGAGECVGIAASPPMIVGNSQEAKDPSTGQQVGNWGLGMTEASGLCYELTGPGGKVLVALTDRCGGYCSCNGSGFQECGPCVSAPDMATQCPCVGTVPPVYSACCGQGCGGTVTATCDWCASNNHPHFDLDTGTFNKLCAGSSNLGSCKLSAVKYVKCLDVSGWPPGGGGGGPCGPDSFHCTGGMAHQDQVPGSTCCCNYNECPGANAAAGCAKAPSQCKGGSCACAAGQPDATHAQVPSTGCCCLSGLAPQADGTCN